MSKGLPQNAVERVAEILRSLKPDLQLPDTVIRLASEQYRLLATRVPIGKILLQPASQKDTAERRAAALLEYSARLKVVSLSNETSCSNPELSRQALWSTLAAAVHLKSPDPLQQLQHVLINFLQPVAKINPQTKTATSCEDENCGIHSNNRRKLRHRDRTIKYKDSLVASHGSTINPNIQPLYKPRILPELVIRLAGYLVDPHGTEKIARNLLRDIYSFYENDSNFDATQRSDCISSFSNAAERRGHLYDLQRYAAAYEAAALYFVATSSYLQDLGGSDEIRNSKSRSEKNVKKNNKRKDEPLSLDLIDEENGNEEIDDCGNATLFKDEPILRDLQINDLVDASSEFTFLEFKQVLPRIKELAVKFRNRQSVVSKNQRREAHIDKLFRNQNQNDCVDSKLNKTRNKRTIDGKAIHINEKLHDEISNVATGTMFDGPSGKDGYTFEACSSRSLENWKETVLSRAKRLAIDKFKNLHCSDSSDVATIEIKEEQALALAADAILQKYKVTH